ncbi:SusF/SusE family outer membrane protein [Lentimicrobium sp. L6]|uniref:SusE domain-containing protein n=1 Tax=Lentimicrobium sp. L6 TaxID=2735916 RepID=UPI001555E3D9|nr:SusE domain-containing protein [Lentimicrobium sp. L6]NPD85671.1 SusF/SusE family outer membrane protein [Lentimicrobium sp. L6]
MKKITILYLGLFSLLLMYSCEKEEKEPILNTEQIAAPVFTSPSSGTAHVLLEANASEMFDAFQWKATGYNLNNLANTVYTVEMDEASNNFESPIFLENTQELEINYTVAQMNTLLLTNNFPADEAANLNFRVKSNITSNNTSESAVSETITLSITPYSSEIKIKSIYMLGDGTDPGWSNTDALPASHIADGKFGIIANLGGEGLFFKFISVLGQWAPQWGTDDAGTGENGNLVYRPTEDVADPVAMPCPTDAGLYRIVVDTANLTYEVYAASSTLYLLGDGSPAGWDNTAATEMTNDGAGKFSLTADLTANSIKFVEVLGQWAPQWGTVDGASGYGGSLAFRPTEADPDPVNIPVPADGTYLIEVDLAAQTYNLTPQ